MKARWVAVAVLSVSSTALADPTKQQCADADTQAQVLRDAHKFREAQAQLDICTLSACPQLVRQDCNERLADLNRVAPSVIFDVKDRSGRDLPATKVTMDGKPLVDQLTGLAVAVDPGDHTFSFSTAGHLPRTDHVLINEGDKDRRISVVMGSPAAEQPPDETPEQKTQEQPLEEHHAAVGSGQRIAGIVVGGVGLVGLGLAGIFTIVATNDWSAAQSECGASSCMFHDQAVSDHNTAYDYAVAATFLVVGGGVLAGTGLLLAVFAPHKDTHRGLRVLPMVGQTNGVMLSGAFP